MQEGVLVGALHEVKKFLEREGQYRERPFLDYAVGEIDRAAAESEGTTFFVSAPTGYGKTAISMATALKELRRGYKAIIAYPLRALVEEQREKFCRMFAGRYGPVVGVRMMGVSESQYLVHPVVLTTVDTLSLTAVGLSPEDVSTMLRYENALGHYLFSWGSVWLSSIVLDEVHLLCDSTKSLSFLAAMLKVSSYVFGNSVIVMSATMPRVYVDALRSFSYRPVTLSFAPDMDPRFVEERMGKKYRVNVLELPPDEKFERIEELLKQSRFTRALVVFNTVEEAQRFYSRLSFERKLLVHSRYSPEDRERKIGELKTIQREGGVIVATQVIEAGVNISSDLIVTDAAPASTLVQRFGRFLRFEKEQCADPERCAYVWFSPEELQGDRYKVYDAGLTKETLSYIEKNPDVNLHVGYEEMLNSVYRQEHARVDPHYVGEVFNIFAYLSRASKPALDLLLRSEGSLVRESSLFCAETLDGVKFNADYNFIEKHCVPGECPKNLREALLRAIEAERATFRVRCTYSTELGVTCSQGGAAESS
ncbi:MAG: CRISPR-associated helicase Cas3' [Thermofilaceae archaeon]